MRLAWAHLKAIIEYGEWDVGWELYKNKPMCLLVHGYYNGDHICLHLGPLWLCVSY